MLVSFREALDVSDLIAEYTHQLKEDMPRSVTAVSGRMARKTKVGPAITSEQQALVEAIPNAMARDKLATLYRRGEVAQIQAGFRRGENSVNRDKHSYLWATLEALISFRSLSKSALREGMQRLCGWSAPTAMARVSLGWQIAIAIELATEQGGCLVLSPMFGVENVSQQ